MITAVATQDSKTQSQKGDENESKTNFFQRLCDELHIAFKPGALALPK